jgi:type VI secretion system protein ImpH
MDTFGWRKSASVQQWLFAEPYRFEFTQAIRILEQIALAAEAPPSAAAGMDPRCHVPLGAGPDPSREAVRLRSHVGFDFPASEVRTLEPTKNGPPQLTLNLFNLAGASAPLPDWVAELLQHQERDRDHGLRDFLDIFHHRLLSLLYRIQLHHRPWLDPLDHSADPSNLRARNKMAQYLLSFAGLGVRELQGRLAIADEELLPYAGLLWQRPRSMIGLQRILEHALGTPVSGRQLLGVWRRIEPEDRTRLGPHGRNRSLGRTTTLGTRVWDTQGRFDLTLGPLTIESFEDLLPGRPMHRRLHALTQFYAGDLMDICVHLTIEPKSIPRTRLGRRSRLGWTSWIGTKPPEKLQTILLPTLQETFGFGGEPCPLTGSRYPESSPSALGISPGER